MASSKNFEPTTSSCNDCGGNTLPQASSGIESQGDTPTTGQYKEFSHQFRMKTVPQRIPTNGSIEIIENCNFRCIHCYQGQNKAKKTLSAERWCEIIDELAEAGTLWLLLTGGEPLLHPDFSQIYTHAIKRGMIVTVFTNGALFKDHHFELFKKYPPFSIEITLYGASEAMYTKVTQTKNQLAKVKATCQRLRAEKIPLKLKSVAFTPLMDDIPDLKKWVEEDLGLTFRFDTKLDPGIYGESFDEIRAKPEDLVNLEAQLIDPEGLVGDLMHFKNLYETYKKNKTEQEFVYTCGAGKNSFYIDYKGFVHTCSTGRLEEEAFDLTKMSFKNIWFDELPKVIFEEVRSKNSACQTCEYRGFCDVCPATAKLATGSKEGQPMYICQHTMMRKKKFLEEMPLEIL